MPNGAPSASEYSDRQLRCGGCSVFSRLASIACLLGHVVPGIERAGLSAVARRIPARVSCRYWVFYLMSPYQGWRRASTGALDRPCLAVYSGADLTGNPHETATTLELALRARRAGARQPGRR